MKQLNFKMLQPNRKRKKSFWGGIISGKDIVSLVDKNCTRSKIKI